VEYLKENEETSRQELLRDLTPEQRKTGLLPELIGAQPYKANEFDEKVDWMMKRGLLDKAPKYEEIVRGK
jgi:hypothetical protein